MKQSLKIASVVGGTLGVLLVARALKKPATPAQKVDPWSQVVPPPPDASWLRQSWIAENQAAPLPTGGSAQAQAWIISTAGRVQYLDAVSFLDERFARPEDRPTRLQLSKVLFAFRLLGVQDDGRIYRRPSVAVTDQALDIATSLDMQQAPPAVGKAVRDFSVNAYQVLPEVKS